MTDFQFVYFEDNVGVTTGTTWTAPLGTGFTVEPAAVVARFAMFLDGGPSRVRTRDLDGNE